MKQYLNLDTIFIVLTIIYFFETQLKQHCGIHVIATYRTIYSPRIQQLQLINMVLKLSLLHLQLLS